jgi:hypothetical protein
MVQLAYRGYLPGHDTPQQLIEYEMFYTNCLAVSFVVNCMTFLETLFWLPLLHAGFFYL